MQAKRLPWFRMYTDFLNDPKMISLAFEDQRHFVGILALKSDGALESEVEDSLMDRIVAQRLWIDHGVIRDVKKRLINAGLIGFDWHPLAWDKRQMNSDKDESNALRQQRYRNALRNGPVTRSDTDTDIDKEVDKKNTKQLPPPDGVSSSVWSDFLLIRKTKKAAVTQTTIEGIARESEKAGMSLNESLSLCCERGWSSFRADWLKEKHGARTSNPAAKASPGKHTGFQNLDYKTGINEDGTFA